MSYAIRKQSKQEFTIEDRIVKNLLKVQDLNNELSRIADDGNIASNVGMIWQIASDALEQTSQIMLTIGMGKLDELALNSVLEDYDIYHETIGELNDNFAIIKSRAWSAISWLKQLSDARKGRSPRGDKEDTAELEEFIAEDIEKLSKLLG